MPATARPLSPHLGIYRWQIQMVTSILHRATGIALAAGTLLLVVALLALASGPDAWAKVAAFCASWPGTILLLGWTWALAYHLLNGIRHLMWDAGMGFELPEVYRSGYTVITLAVVLTAVIWFIALRGGA